MITLMASEIATALSARLVGADVAINSVSTDSRQIAPGDLFIALQGPNFDGHKFAEEVVNKGACALVVTRHLDVPVPQLIVADTRLALGQLGALVKSKLKLKTVAVTGSVGKTTVKEMMAAILSRIGNVLATAGNFNNEIGVPLTLLRLHESHNFAVMELGANHLGEIAYTSSLVKPDVALITIVAPAHIEGFGDIFGVARAKGEIYSGLSAGGTAILPLDSDYHSYWLPKVQHLNVQSFSATQHADIYADNIELDAEGCAGFELHTPQGHCFVQLTLPGKHNVHNALAATAAVLALGASLTDVQLGLAAMQPVKGRINVYQPKAGLRIIDDTYNANVESAKAAIDLLASYGGQRYFVLGDMGELGPDARIYHEEVGIYAKQAGINGLFTLGVLSQNASEQFHQQGAHFSSRDHLLSKLHALLKNKEEVSILVKGSRSARMELVVQDLLERCQQETSAC
ncbi:UDP-N-acetylmuramoyl-tripeptide--D-alanyl-D-alanine ligase [Rheinheimera sp. F8]|uniref:UDP-N-acetylmuramoyl-tripeptide--D-alanyl-D- alanine ligase n=1 Tax=Rheinheimera sp. F8 TaxID=1763998 RepID=UPI0007448393|nr:UDP-N-acetylmuramoyl-tripeptide--D-alanyl-D-alanine ligase [Rheinheimera sp. F8]ALZ75885.1 UDP-N-acetylmuramoyl-tripeptide--D-alanyl-D-alanine ligase [Rheinheimera sp. F8]